MSIRKQLFVVMSVLCILLIILQGASTYFLFHNKLVSEYAGNISNYAHQNSSLFNTFTRKVEECIISLSNDTMLYEYVTSSDESHVTINQRSASVKKDLINRIVVPMFHYANRYTYTFFANADMPFSKAFATNSQGNIVQSESAIAQTDWFAHILAKQGHPLWFTRPDTPGYVYAGMEVRYSVNTVTIAHVGTILIRFPVDVLLGNAEQSWYTPGTTLLLMENDQTLLSARPLPDQLTQQLGNAQTMTFEALSNSDTPSSVIVKIGGTEYIRGFMPLEMDWLMMTFTPVNDLRSRSAVFLSAIPPIVLLVILAVFFVSFFVSRAMSRPLQKLTEEITEAGNDFQHPIDSTLESGISEIRFLHNAYNQLLQRIHTQMAEIYQKGVDVKQAELRVLQAQINPHFLYNTLDSISWAALDLGDSSIPQVLSSLSKLLRYSIKEPDRLVMISDEIDIVKRYIEIQEFCLSLKVHLRWEGEQMQPTLYVPKLTLQPIFENAILHGMNEQNLAEGEIVIRAQSDQQCIIIEVENQGTADIERINRILTEENDTGKNGIRNVHYRLQMLFGGRSGLSFRNTEDGHFVATITIERQENA